MTSEAFYNVRTLFIIYDNKWFVSLVINWKHSELLWKNIILLKGNWTWLLCLSVSVFIGWWSQNELQSEVSIEYDNAHNETDSVLRVTMIIVQVEVVVTRVMSSVGLQWKREQNLTPTLICSPSTASTLVRLCSKSVGGATMILTSIN